MRSFGCGFILNMAVIKILLFVHLFYLGSCVFAAEVSDSVLDVLTDAVSDSMKTDRLSQQMFKLYHRYNRDDHWPKDTNTVRSFKAKPGEFLSGYTLSLIRL